MRAPVDHLGFYCGYLGKEADSRGGKGKTNWDKVTNRAPFKRGGGETRLTPPTTSLVSPDGPLTDKPFISRGLTSSEIDSYTSSKGGVISRDLANRVRILKVPFLPKPGGKGGMTIGRFILLTPGAWKGTGGSKLLAHELGHVSQQDQAGMFRFVSKYLSDYARKRIGNSHQVAYRAIPAEEDAEAKAVAWKREASKIEAEDLRRRNRAWWKENRPDIYSREIGNRIKGVLDSVKDISRRAGESLNDKSK